MQDSLCFREESRQHLEECQRLAMTREDIMADVDNRLMEVEQAVRHLVFFRFSFKANIIK